MYLSNPTIQTILEKIVELNLASDELVVLFFGEKTILDYEQLIEELNQQEVVFLGAFFPGIIYNDQNFDTGVLFVKYRSKTPLFIVEDLGSVSEQNLFDNQEISIPEIQKEASTALVLVDGLSAHIAQFLAELYNYWGSSINYIGGGAGSLSLEQKPCLLCSKGLLEDAAIICFIDAPIGLGVQHGWQELEGPIIATRTKKNVIYELNWKNAFEVYKESIQTDKEVHIGQNNFFDVAKGYPLGIKMEGQEDIVRDPIAVGNDGELICVGEIESHSVLNILKGEHQNLIQAASMAAREALSKVEKKTKQLLLVDCISRTLFLEDQFAEELKAITEIVNQETTSLDLVGILSLGEISSNGEGLLYFYNKTIVIGAFY